MRLGIDASNIRAGGGLTHLSELLRAAQPQEYGITQVTVWAGQKTLKEISTRSWLDLVYDPILDKSLPLRVYWQTVKLSQQAKNKSDILFIPGGIYLGHFLPFVTMSQNMLPFEDAERKRYSISWIYIRCLLLKLNQSHTFRKANGIIFLTEYACATIMKYTQLRNLKTTIIPHGIDRRFHLKPRPQKDINTYSVENPFRFLYVSIIDVYKHQWHVAKAVACLRQAGIPVILELIGPAYSPSLHRLHQVIKELDPDQKFIHYLGSIPFSELETYYHQADGFVFASSCENMPNILLEAMASGLPIACSNRGPMPEMLGDAGIYFDPEQPNQIANALLTLIENPALREMYAWTAYQRALAYSWERCAQETFAFIASVVASNKEKKG